MPQLRSEICVEYKFVSRGTLFKFLTQGWAERGRTHGAQALDLLDQVKPSCTRNTVSLPDLESPES